ncbi:putative oxidoreductase, nitronate monooxygenase family [Olavius algarvensis associated proteobacterium Delta 3]|nr:putative oxidoreductase, nitronate monooxygenase family [Olavius algarvensis associated proteobacterium Delta 3]CAB5137313.1 putative oxidoreductase, nitronate monooxygenase family [Olavius algarvensis associated proteobacterium Delta 3]
MLIDRFLTQGREFLGSRYPIMCGAMTWVSDPGLVSAVGNAGGFGLLAGGNAPAEILRQQIEETRRLTDQPFGVNMITLAPAYREHLDLVCDMGLDFIVFAGGIPRKSDIQQAKACGGRVVCFAPTAPLALNLIDRGADALILEGSEAGGHIGPVALSVLIQQILFEVDSVPVFVAGGIATGRMMAHLLMMGAAGVQMGTRFIMSEECKAHPNFKEAFRKAKAKDAVATPSFDSRLPVIPVRALKNAGTIEFAKLQIELLQKLDSDLIDRKLALYAVENFWVGALKDAVIDGDITKGSLMAGQSVGLADEVKPLKGIIDEMVEHAEAELKRLKGVLSTRKP